MHDIWNPWHGCKKISEGCQNCYMYYLDKVRAGIDSSYIYKNKTNFDYPLKKDKNGEYKIKSGEQIRICMTSDFFLEEADIWRDDVWKIIKIRSDVKFFILTKRAHRISKCLPDDWLDGYDNVILNVTCENQKRADERIPILLDIPAKHKGIMVAPFIGKVSISKYLKSGAIEQVIAGGENYDGSRICKYEWVKCLSDECINNNVTFCFIETGNKFEKDSKVYFVKTKELQSKMAYRLNVNFKGKEIKYNLKRSGQLSLFDEKINYTQYFSSKCSTCASMIICNGCSRCGKCGEDVPQS